jgi:hypothetical protein
MGKYPWKDYRWFVTQVFKPLNPIDRHTLLILPAEKFFGYLRLLK